MRKTIILFSLFITFNVSAQDEVLYQNAFAKLSGMLDGTKELSFKEAVFTVENAYLNGTLDTVFLNDRIEFLKNLSIKIRENGTLKYEEKDKKLVQKYASLFTVMKDSTLLVNQNGETFVHLPFTYDFDDVFGHQNWENMFVSKLLKTHKGNCHSLPYLYKILAEELDVEAHLALAPNHIYIKHQSKKDGWYNTELTSGIFPIDAWLMASGYIHLDAIRNGVYMKALTDKESVALCLVDLAQGYKQKEFHDLEFVIKCAEKALEYFPNCVRAMILKTDAQGKKIENILYGHRTDFSDVNKYPETRKMLLEIQNQLTKIHELGYRQMPEGMYLNWLVSLKAEKEKYTNKKITTFNHQTN